MRRLTASLLAIAAVVAFAAPAPAYSRVQGPCFAYSSEAAVEVLEAAPVVVIGRVVQTDPGRSATIAPEVYLKGATSPNHLTLLLEPGLPCAPALLAAADRLLLVLGTAGGTLAWPGIEQTFVLREGQAYRADALNTAITTESALIDEVRGITGQYSVPAATTSEGASLDWFGTVLPVTGAVLVVFAIGLVLMREWHRIDPS